MVLFCTFVIISGSWYSRPPLTVNPHGAPPVRTTSTSTHFSVSGPAWCSMDLHVSLSLMVLDLGSPDGAPNGEHEPTTSMMHLERSIGFRGDTDKCCCVAVHTSEQMLGLWRFMVDNEDVVQWRKTHTSQFKWSLVTMHHPHTLPHRHLFATVMLLRV